MMTTSKPLVENDEGIDEVSFAGTSHIEAPVFSPEIKSDEDLLVLLRTVEALDKGAPIIVPSNSWRSIRSAPKFSDFSGQIEDLVRNRPVLYREPVELYRYRRPQVLVSYALAEGSSRKFYRKLGKHEFDAAINMLPEFLQPFVECQMERLLEVKDIEVPPEYEDTVRTTTEGWTDDRVDDGFRNYFARIVQDAQRNPDDAGLVPPTPPITEGSDETTLIRARGVNHGMVQVVREVNEGHFGKPVYPYLHMYVDHTVFKNTTENDLKVVDAIRQEIKNRQEEASFTDIGEGGVSYQGVVLTISNLDKVWDRNMTMRLKRFVKEVESVARAHDLPVIVPRSGWHGLYLTDLGVQTFSSLFNGNECYNARSGAPGPEAKYGKTPFYGEAVQPGVSDAFEALKRTDGNVHPIPGLPDSPPRFDTTASDWEKRLGDPRSYRREFSKPRRLLHAQEAREIRSAKKRGEASPAENYLRKSSNNDFS